MAPDADARRDEVDDTRDGVAGEEAGDREGDPPPQRGFALDDAADLLGDPVETAMVLNQGRARERRRFHLGQNGRGGMVGVGVGH